MSFFRKLWNSITGNKVKIEVTIDEPVVRSTGQLSGAVVISSRKDQEVDLSFSLQEELKTGRGKNKKLQEMEVGQLSQGISIVKKESKTVPFLITFDLEDSKYDKMKEKGGFSAMRGSIGKFMSGEKANYTLFVDANPKGKATPASEEVEIKMIHREKNKEE